MREAKLRVKELSSIKNSVVCAALRFALLAFFAGVT